MLGVPVCTWWGVIYILTTRGPLHHHGRGVIHLNTEKKNNINDKLLHHTGHKQTHRHTHTHQSDLCVVLLASGWHVVYVLLGRRLMSGWDIIFVLPWFH